MKPEVSIVIACYNDPNIVTAVRSAYEQTLVEKEIIVVNDGSNEATVRAIRSVEQFIDVIIDQKNQGQSIARNNGIRKAEGEFILNLDSDDFFEPDFCQKALEILRNRRDVKIVTCFARRFDKQGTIDIFKPLGGDIKKFLIANSALGSSMFRKKDWAFCGGYEEDLPILGFEDWELYIQILKKGGTAHVIPEILFNYQIRKNSTTYRIKDAKQDKYYQIVLKHKELYKENFDLFTDELFSRIKKLELDKQKIRGGKEHKLGEVLLKPLRMIKNIWR